MKNILHILLILFFCLTIISCAKESGSSSSSTTSTMSTPFVSDGNYKLTAAVEAIYYSDGTHYRTTMYSLSHDSSVTPGYLGYTLEWKGSGVFRITLVGKATFSATGISDGTVDCSTNQILETTLDTDGNVTDTTPIQTGCGGTSISLTIVSEKYTAVSGGFTKYNVVEDSYSNQVRITYTYQKQ